jgi:peptide/nickel transport system substrate-binding protein
LCEVELSVRTNLDPQPIGRKKVNKISRREFIHISALAAAGVTVAACAKGTEAPKEEPTAPPGQEEKTTATATPVPAAEAAGNEAPALAEQVASGALSPLNERLPATPMVVGPGVLVVEEDLDWEVGTYEGGILRTVTTNPTWSYPCQHALESILNCPKHHTGPLSGNLVESFTVNDNVTEFTFNLRKGMKWSDGEPLTTDDIRFAWEDRQLNEQITPVLPSVFKSGADPAGDPMTVDFVDDYSFKVTFTAPTGRFLKTLGMGNLWDPYPALIEPKHYLKQFHTTYTPIADLKPLLEAEGLTEGEWHRLFQAKGGTWWGGGCEHEAEELPVLRGWIIMPSPEDQIIMERNPYYHKVDTEGKQLPYVGRIEAKVVSTPENIPSTIITGEINFCREILHHTDVGLYKEHEGDAYKVNLDMVYHNAPVSLMFNYNNPDEAWQKVVLNNTFRRAVNAAINFQEIIDALFLGLGRPCPWFPPGGDPDLANQLLDEMGMDQRDEEGYRLDPDGNRFEVFMEIVTDPLFGQPAELIASHLDAVGLRTTLKQLESALFGERRDANELFASIDWLDACNWPYIMWDYMGNSRINWGIKWDDWMRTQGEEGQEPPDWIKELYDIDSELRAINPNSERAQAAEQRFADWCMENIHLFPIAQDVADPCIVPPNLANVPHSGRSSAMMFAEEQLFFKA